MLEVVTRQDYNASTTTNQALNLSSQHAVRQECISLSLTLVGKSLFATKKSLSWEKKDKFPIGMFCRKTRRAVGGMAASKGILSGVQRVWTKKINKKKRDELRDNGKVG
jgi:hypothetical protein